MISQRAWLIGGVGFCFYLIAIVNTLPSFYYALTWLAVGVLASSLGIALLSLIGLRCAWRAPRTVVSQSLDEEHEVPGPAIELQMANAGTLNKTGVIIEARVTRLDSQTPDSQTSDSKTATSKKQSPQLLTRRFLLEALPSGQSLTTQLPLTQLPRGRYRVEELRLSGSDPLGLFRIEKRIAPGLSLNENGEVTNSNGSTPRAHDELIVGPPALFTTETTSLNLSSSRGEGSVAATRSLGQGDDVRGTRLYTPGDDLRHVHWKSTARKSQLVVKEFHHTLQSRAMVVWDGEANTNYGSSRSSQNTREWGLALAASLCRAMEERHLPCTLIRLDNRPQQAGQSAVTRATANASLPNAALTMSQVSELLSEADTDRTSDLIAALSTLPAGSSLLNRDPHSSQTPGDIYFITASLTPEAVRATQIWRAGGARVTIALLDGAAFQEGARAAAGKVGRSTRERRKTPRGDEAQVTREKYEAQAKLLRQAGARVVIVAPRVESAQNGTLATAMHALLYRETPASQAAPNARKEAVA